MNMNSELKTPALVHAAAREAIRTLTEMNNQHEVPMSEFTKVLIWEKTESERLANEELERDKYNGWKITKRTWCGVPVAEFEVPSLGIYAKKKKNE